MEKHYDIILEALRDYRNWFVGQGGSPEEIEQDERKIHEIDEAIEYIEKLTVL